MDSYSENSKQWLMTPQSLFQRKILEKTFPIREESRSSHATKPKQSLSHMSFQISKLLNKLNVFTIVACLYEDKAAQLDGVNQLFRNVYYSIYSTNIPLDTVVTPMLNQMKTK